MKKYFIVAFSLLLILTGFLILPQSVFASHCGAKYATCSTGWFSMPMAPTTWICMDTQGDTEFCPPSGGGGGGGGTTPIPTPTPTVDTNPGCGSTDGQTIINLSPSTPNLCKSGSPSDFSTSITSSTGYFVMSWNCGSSVCSAWGTRAPVTPPPTPTLTPTPRPSPVDGVCGTGGQGNGYCAAGASTVYNFMSQTDWWCAGQNGGKNVHCPATPTPTPRPTATSTTPTPTNTSTATSTTPYPFPSTTPICSVPCSGKDKCVWVHQDGGPSFTAIAYGMDRNTVTNVSENSFADWMGNSSWNRSGGQEQMKAYMSFLQQDSNYNHVPAGKPATYSTIQSLKNKYLDKDEIVKGAIYPGNGNHAVIFLSSKITGGPATGLKCGLDLYSYQFEVLDPNFPDQVGTLTCKDIEVEQKLNGVRDCFTFIKCSGGGYSSGTDIYVKSFDTQLTDDLIAARASGCAKYQTGDLCKPGTVQNAHRRVMAMSQSMAQAINWTMPSASGRTGVCAGWTMAMMRSTYTNNFTGPKPPVGSQAVCASWVGGKNSTSFCSNGQIPCAVSWGTNIKDPDGTVSNNVASTFLMCANPSTPTEIPYDYNLMRQYGQKAIANCNGTTISLKLPYKYPLPVQFWSRAVPASASANLSIGSFLAKIIRAPFVSMATAVRKILAAVISTDSGPKSCTFTLNSLSGPLQITYQKGHIFSHPTQQATQSEINEIANLPVENAVKNMYRIWLADAVFDRYSDTVLSWQSGADEPTEVILDQYSARYIDSIWSWMAGKGINDSCQLSQPLPTRFQHFLDNANGVEDITPAVVNITNINHFGYKMIANLEGGTSGTKVYSDRTYTFTDLPAVIAGATFLQTPNADKDQTGTNFLTFTIDKPVTVYVALDSRIITPPAWLSSWVKQTGTLTVSDTAGPNRTLFTKWFPAGQATLGANRDANTPTGLSMYSVFFVPTATSPATPTPAKATLTLHVSNQASGYVIGGSDMTANPVEINCGQIEQNGQTYPATACQTKAYPLGTVITLISSTPSNALNTKGEMNTWPEGCQSTTWTGSNGKTSPACRYTLTKDLVLNLTFTPIISSTAVPRMIIPTPTPTLVPTLTPASTPLPVAPTLIPRSSVTPAPTPTPLPVPATVSLTVRVNNQASGYMVGGSDMTANPVEINCGQIEQDGQTYTTSVCQTKLYPIGTVITLLASDPSLALNTKGHMTGWPYGCVRTTWTNAAGKVLEGCNYTLTQNLILDFTFAPVTSLLAPWNWLGNVFWPFKK